MQKVTPCLWMDGRTEEAAQFYISIFKDGKIHDQRTRQFDGGPQPKGTPLVVVFEIQGQRLMLLNGGPIYKLSPSFSLSVSTEDQTETDYYWNALIDGGAPSQCGWLVDKYGLSWQIVPKRLPQLLGDCDPARAQRAMAAMLKMQKIEIADLERAAAG